ncbi:DUF5658 family protein [Planococcus antarcticus]|uniref:DUF5658 family protein n=1 Tax=Planococcus antarcticus TaxID=161360 RepID=UPI0038B2C8C5
MRTDQQSTPLRKYVWSLVILNFFDGLLTYIGLSFGVINEANPLLVSLSPLALLGIKILLSFCLFSFLFTPFIEIQSRMWRYALFFVNLLYSGILLLHLLWLIILFV